MAASGGGHDARSTRVRPMKADLTDTDASAIAGALVRARRAAGSPAMGMVMTLVVVTEEDASRASMEAAAHVASEHPARVLGVVLDHPRGKARLDATVRVGQSSSGESVLLRMSGELVEHADSVVLPLLLPDSPVVVWWPGQAPQTPAADPLGLLGQRRITDAAATSQSTATLLTLASNYSPGDTDLAWARLTPWRALLTAALDQHPVTVTGAEVRAERRNPSAVLLAAWLRSRLNVHVDEHVSRGPGITRATLTTRHGNITISRPSGGNAVFSIPGEADRPVALRRRPVAELMAEEMRRLDEDDVYAATIRTLVERTDQPA
jgi:glucose-6-phosphate dehydrogenase assembly protein OpcA